MTSGNQWREEKRRARTLSPLNLAISARYDACVKAGGHTPSKQWVDRDHGGRQVRLKLCRSCGVPINGNSWANAMAAARRGRERQ